MNRKSTIVRHSLSQIDGMRKLGQNHTRVDAPEAGSLGTEFRKSAQVAIPDGKTSFHPHLDSDVVE